MRAYLFCFFCIAALRAVDHRSFDEWRASNANWIKSGLQEPVNQGKFHSKSRLLILDGTKAVGEFKPNGSFHVILEKNPSNSHIYWVQIQASRQQRVLEETKDRISSHLSDVPMVIVRSSNSSMSALRAGPFATQKRADPVRTRVVAAGFRDAFFVKDAIRSPYAWVNENFDKTAFDVQQLGIVSANPETPIGFGDRSYRGILWFIKKGDKYRVVNELPLESYLRAVVPSELGPQVYPELEALKSQAVAARTYAIKSLGRYSKSGYDICDGPACQAYFGAGTEHPLSDQAVAETAGLVMTYQGEFIDALYTSTCGGETDDVENVFPGRAEPYLRGKTSYLMEPASWQLVAKEVGQASHNLDNQDLQIQAMMYGFPSAPSLDGLLGGHDLLVWLDHFSWIGGQEVAHDLMSADLSFRDFWQVIWSRPRFQESVNRQVNKADTIRGLEVEKSSNNLAVLRNFLHRYEVLTAQQERQMELTDKVPKSEAMAVLLSLCRVFGPNPDWSKYYVQDVVGDDLVLVRKGRERIVGFERITCYVTEQARKHRFVTSPNVVEGDIAFVLDGVLARPIVKLEVNGWVASADRVSAYNYWIDKKTTAELETRARRYISNLRGLKDVQVLSRSSTGRVTKLKYVAESGVHVVEGLRIRWSLGVRDNMFELMPSYRNNRLVHMSVVGRGWGHGVGMSQVGAFGLARQGWTFDQILHHYYTGVEIVHIDDKKTTN